MFLAAWKTCLRAPDAFRKSEQDVPTGFVPVHVPCRLVAVGRCPNGYHIEFPRDRGDGGAHDTRVVCVLRARESIRRERMARGEDALMLMGPMRTVRVLSDVPDAFKRMERK